MMPQVPLTGWEGENQNERSRENPKVGKMPLVAPPPVSNPSETSNRYTGTLPELTLGLLASRIALEIGRTEDQATASGKRR